MSGSSARLDDEGLEIVLGAAARFAGVHPRRRMVIPPAEIVDVTVTDARAVASGLRWKVAGTALSRQRAMGWFSRPGHRGRWAWVWLTPGRTVRVITTTRRRPALVAVPDDWFADDPGAPT